MCLLAMVLITQVVHVEDARTLNDHIVYVIISFNHLYGICLSTYAPVQLEPSKPCGSSRTFLAHGVSGIFCVVVI